MNNMALRNGRRIGRQVYDMGKMRYPRTASQSSTSLHQPPAYIPPLDISDPPPRPGSSLRFRYSPDGAGGEGLPPWINC